MTIAKGSSRVIITMPTQLKETLEKEAQQENRSLSNYLLTILEKK